MRLAKVESKIRKETLPINSPVSKCYLKSTINFLALNFLSSYFILYTNFEIGCLLFVPS